MNEWVSLEGFHDLIEGVTQLRVKEGMWQKRSDGLEPNGFYVRRNERYVYIKENVKPLETGWYPENLEILVVNKKLPIYE